MGYLARLGQAGTGRPELQLFNLAIGWSGKFDPREYRRSGDARSLTALDIQRKVSNAHCNILASCLMRSRRADNIIGIFSLQCLQRTVQDVPRDSYSIGSLIDVLCEVLDPSTVQLWWAKWPVSDLHRQLLDVLYDTILLYDGVYRDGLVSRTPPGKQWRWKLSCLSEPLIEQFSER